MSDPLLRLLVGISIICLSIALIVGHRRAWRRQLAQFGKHRHGTPPDAQLVQDLEPELSSIENGSGSVSQGNGKANSLAEEVGDASEQVEAVSTESRSPYSVDDTEVLRHYRWQMIQRSVTSTGIGLVGVLMILSDYVASPTAFAFGLFFTVLVVLAVFASAMVDAVRTQLFFRKNDQGFREAKRELLKEYARLQAKQREQSSEHPSSSDR